MVEERGFGPLKIIPGSNNGYYPFCHSLYIEDSGVIIDPASDRKRLLELREKNGANEIWLSHWHEDHLMHLDLFDDLPLCIHQQDAPPLSDLEVFLDWHGLERGKCDHQRETWRRVMKAKFNFCPRQPNRYLCDREVIELKNETVETIHTPGHSPGGLSFFFKESGILFLGDFDLTSFGPYYGDLYSSIDQTIDSIRLLRSIPAKIWLTSHGAGIFENIPDKVWDNYLLVIQKREDNILDYLNQPRTIDEIINRWFIFGKRRESFSVEDLILMERISIQKHMDRLIKQEVVSYCDGVYYLK